MVGCTVAVPAVPAENATLFGPQVSFGAPPALANDATRRSWPFWICPILTSPVGVATGVSSAKQEQQQKQMPGPQPWPCAAHCAKKAADGNQSALPVAVFMQTGIATGWYIACPPQDAW